MSSSQARLSVNINKYALLRNSRGADAPNLLWAADVCIAAGAHGITVHPRLDERHVRFSDVAPLAEHLRAHHPGIELNIECEPAPSILDIVLAIVPAQCTLVPVRPGEVTSDHGWDLPHREAELRAPIAALRAAGIRVSLFMDTDAPNAALQSARAVGADRIELYTGPYAHAWGTPAFAAELARIQDIAERAAMAGLELNAGHDLDRHNLVPLQGLRGLCEVSIGHAQIVRALSVGTTQSVQELLGALGWPTPLDA